MAFSNIQAVLFDLDGTLIDSAPDLGAAVDRMRVARGLPSEAAQRAEAAAPAIDPALREQAQQAVRSALQKLEQETAQGHGKASTAAANALRAVLKQQGRNLAPQAAR